jgi:hypothetical protein
MIGERDLESLAILEPSARVVSEELRHERCRQQPGDTLNAPKKIAIRRLQLPP